MRRLFASVTVIAATYAGLVWWRRHPRVGTRMVNEVISPWLVEHGLVERSRGELAILEHVGRRSGIVRRTPVHPERIPGGVRVMLPLGERSEWARNVLAAGHCRLQVGDEVVELDEPLLVEPADVDGLPAPIRALQGWLGFRYLLLRRFAEAPGTLEPEAPLAADVSEAVPVG
ncbi:MAG TPA: nitroreductase/quinone reductase family protein [Candidatus Dormibacteraeota bacterium]|nr:nitroreductase/quinone reductase family protein [Candidatus Dormibacteraeota bacterium]